MKRVLRTGAIFASATLLPAALPTLAAEGAMLDEIVVTARKRDESLQHVPMAVTAFNAEQLEAAQIANITDLERMTPNITISDTGGLVAGSVSVFVRGIGNDPGFDQGIGIYIDDIYLNRTTGALIETYDIERIEVLKGPQGHLYGRNTIGGAIKYVTRRPGDEFQADAQVKIGEFDLGQIRGSASGPLVADRLYGTVGVIVKRQDGIQRNAFDGRRFWDGDFRGYRAGLLARFSDNLSAYLTADYSKDSSQPRIPKRVAVNAAQLTGIDFVISGANRFLGPGIGLVSTPNDISIPSGIDVVNTELGAAFDKYEIETKTFALTVEWDILDRWRLKSVTAVRSVDNVQVFDFDGSSQQFITTIVPRNADDYSQELQLNYSGDDVNAVLGAYFLDATQESLTDNPQYPRLRAVQMYYRTVFENEETLKSESVYASVDWNFVEKWQLSLGGRYTTDKKEIDQMDRVDNGWYALARLQGFPASAIVAVAPGQEVAAEASPMFGGWVANSRFFQQSTINTLRGGGTWSEFTPSAKLSWFAGDDLLIYAGYSTGFKTGGYNSTGAGIAAKYAPETVESYTLGLKTTLGGNFRVNAELFYNDYTDKQLSVIALVNNTLSAVNSNVGKMKTQGGEIEMTWAPLSDLLLALNVGYLDTKVNSYPTRDAAGNPIDIGRYTAIGFSPEWTAQARVQYGFTVGDMGRITLGVDVAHRDESFTNSPIDLRDPLSQVQVQKSHEIWNASAAWNSPSEKWRVALEGRNLDDERVLTSTYKVGPFLTGAYNMPRTWALSVAYAH
ncbi:MAG: TonB-dependent receptor [Pseudomonadales bacterium]|jgi:iron complex outermembrane receptor protein|nr:TonB-dependent receptor [Pseudomonadales bacterium]